MSASGCDLSKELEDLKLFMYKEFTKLGRPPVYDPEEFELLCHRAGAKSIFKTIADAMTTERQSKEREIANRKRAVSIIYKLCYGLSQVCNWLQTDHALF